MVHIDIPRVKGKMAERGFTITSLSELLGIDRNMLPTYLNTHEKVPYSIVSDVAGLLCDSEDEAVSFFCTGLT